MYTAMFYEPRQNVGFNFSQVRCAHKSGDVIKILLYSHVEFLHD